MSSSSSERMVSIKEFEEGVADLYKCAKGEDPDLVTSDLAMNGVIAMTLFGVVMGGGSAENICQKCFYKYFCKQEEKEWMERSEDSLPFEKILDVAEVSNPVYLKELDRALGMEEGESTVYYRAPFHEVSYLLWSSKLRRRLCVPSRGKAYFTKYVATMARGLEEYTKKREEGNLAYVRQIMERWSKQSYEGYMVQGMQNIPSEFEQVESAIELGQRLAKHGRKPVKKINKRWNLTKTPPRVAVETASVDMEDLGLLPCVAATMEKMRVTQRCDNEQRMFLVSLCYELGVERQDAHALVNVSHRESMRSYKVRVDHIYDNRRPCLKGCRRLKQVGVCPYEETRCRTPDSFCMQRLHENPRAPLGKFIGLKMLRAHPVPRLQHSAVAKAAIGQVRCLEDAARASNSPIVVDMPKFWNDGCG